MIEFRTYDQNANVMYNLEVEDGMLVRLHCWSVSSGRTVYDERRDPKTSNNIHDEHFMNAVRAMCKDFEFEAFEEFLKVLSDDKQYILTVKSIMSSHAIQMYNQVQKISNAMHNTATKE